MKPSDRLMMLTGVYPALDDLLRQHITDQESRIFVVTWLSGGVPFAFNDTPAVYGAAKCQLARRLGVFAGNIGVTGSAHLGYSLNPNRLGAPFSPSASDIDLFVVASDLYGAFAEEANVFVNDLQTGSVRPRNSSQEKFWPENAKRIVRNQLLGFVDSVTVPTLNRYTVAQKIGNSAAFFVREVNEWSRCIQIKKTSIRVYRTWDYAFDQLARSLRRGLNYSMEQRVQGQPTPMA